MIIKVNDDLCIGCGTCEVLCPNNFKISEAGKAEVTSQEEAECVKQAAESCPVQAIVLE